MYNTFFNVNVGVFITVLPPPPPRPPPPPPVMLNTECIDALNSRADLDFFTEYNKEYLDPEVDDDPFFGINVSSKFYDVDSLSATEFIKNTLLFISLNIQSLQSKFEQFSNEISELSEKNICVDVIALQEVWDVRYPELFSLP
jgi:hypothetical protein